MKSLIATLILAFSTMGFSQSIEKGSEPLDNVVMVSCSQDNFDQIFSSNQVFENSKWLKTLGPSFVSKVGKNGLLVVAEAKSIASPRDLALMQLLSLGSLDASGTIIVGKDRPELAEALKAISPFKDSKQLLSDGAYRLRVVPTVTFTFGPQSGDEANASFSPKIPKNMPRRAEDGISTITGVAGKKDDKPAKIRDLHIQEFVRNSSHPSRLIDAQKLLSELIVEHHQKLVDDLLDSCSKSFGTDFGKLANSAKSIHDWKDLPYDLKSALSSFDYDSTNGSKSMPTDGKIGAVAVGVTLEFGFKDPDGSIHRQSITVFR